MDLLINLYENNLSLYLCLFLFPEKRREKEREKVLSALEFFFLDK